MQTAHYLNGPSSSHSWKASDRRMVIPEQAISRRVQGQAQSGAIQGIIPSGSSYKGRLLTSFSQRVLARKVRLLWVFIQVPVFRVAWMGRILELGGIRMTRVVISRVAVLFTAVITNHYENGNFVLSLDLLQVLQKFTVSRLWGP